MDRFIVGLDPRSELEDDPAIAILERASGAILVRVALAGVLRARQYFEGAVHVYDTEAKARQVWKLFAEG